MAGNPDGAGGGWQNVPLELAHAKADTEPDRPKDTDFVSGTKPEDNKAWLDSLHAPQPSGQCRCGIQTTHTTAYDEQRIAGRNRGLRVAFECPTCRLQREVRKLERALQRTDLPEMVRAEYERFVAAHKQAAA